jgi:diaminopimelate decarboxylase
MLYRSADSNSDFVPVGRGQHHLLGRLCMEHDIVATHVHLPEHSKPGDLLLFCDAGAYDKSMSYVFGYGN